MFDNFQNLIRTDVEEFLRDGKMKKAIELSTRTGQHFNHNEYPMYFTGKLDAKIVLIHLNPQHDNNLAPCHEGDFWWKSFDDYFNYHQDFGKINYGAGSGGTYFSRFDRKQIYFLRPFGVIDFVIENKREDVLRNLERVIECKLQLELIPYSSKTFTHRGFTRDALQPHIERILDVIIECNREYIIFCGSVFERFFDNNITNSYRFKLNKKGGQQSQSHANFSNVRFDYKGHVIHAGIAHSFAQQSMQGPLMEEYGQKCQELYKKEELS